MSYRDFRDNPPDPEPYRTSPSAYVPRQSIDAQEQETRTWGLILHLSLLAGYIVPLAGLIAPIVIWHVKKTELPGLEPHGRAAADWILSSIIFLAVLIPLVFLLIGIPFLLVLGVVSVVFPIIAGIKASQGEYWRYPLAIRFFSPRDVRF